MDIQGNRMHFFMDVHTKIMNKKEELKMLNLELFHCFAVKKTMFLAKKIANLVLKNAKRLQLELLFLKKWI